MAKSFKKVIACLLAVLMVLFSVPFTALANPTDLTPDVNVRFGTLAPDYYDYAPDLSSGAWGPKNLHNTSYCGIYGPTLDYTGGVNETTGALEITKLSLDATKAGPNVYIYNGEITDASEFAGAYSGTPQTDLTTGNGFTMTFSVANVDQLATITGYFTYSNNVEPAYIYDSGTTNGNTKAKIGTKAQYDADTTKKKALLAASYIPNQDSGNFYGDMNCQENVTIGDGEIFLGGASDTGEAVPMASYDAANNDDSVVNPTTGELCYDFANNAILCTLGFIITGEISEANPLVIGFSDKTGGYTGEETLECAYTGNDLRPEDHSRYGTSPNAGLSNKMYFMGYNANSKKYLNGSVEPQEHVHTYDEVYTAPTCTTNGYKTLTCNNSDGLGAAGDDVQTVYDDPETTLGHTAAADKVGVKPATCTEKGYTGDVVCSVCNAVITAGEEIPVTDHTPAAAVQENVVDATCSKAGSYDEVVKCSVCNAEISRTSKTSAKLPHTPAEAVRENVVDATCSKAGSYDEVVKCSVCGEEISRTAKTIDKIAHTPAEAVRENVVDATCTKAGSYDEVVKCSVCGEEISRTAKTIDMIAHTPAAAVEENRVEATEDKDGSYDSVVYCSVCKAEISRTQQTIPALGHTHSYTSTYTAPTCTEAGFTTYTCVKGDDTYTEIDANAPALGHNAVTDAAVAATCTTTGLTEGSHCSRCDAVLTAQEEVAALGHDIVKDAAVAATCTTTGLTEGQHCSRCDEATVAQEEVAALGHDIVIDAAVAPTLDSTGLTEGSHCSRCDEATVPQEVVPALEGVDVTITDNYAAFGDVEGLALGTTKVVKGSDVALKATPAGGCEFVGWQVNNKIVDTDATYKFTAYTDVTVTPVFVDAAAAAENITVVFYDCYMNVTAAYTNVSVADFQAAMAAGIPAGTTYAGKVFNGWSMSDDAIKALDHSATIEANYTDAVNAGYTVTATDGAVFEDGTSEMTGVKYDTEVTVSAEGATAWKINDVIVAYGPTYTFYVGSDVTVTPVKDAVTAKPTVAMVSVDPVEGSHKIAFLATMSAADGYTIIDHGFVYGKAATDDELKIENVGATIAASGTKVKTASLVANSSNQFALNYGIKAKAGTATAVAYITYKDASGKITTDYTKVADGSYTY